MRVADALIALIAFAGLCALFFWAYRHMPDWASAYEAKLQAGAEAVLVERGMSWVQVEMDGQVAHLSGSPPGDGMTDEAAILVLTSSGAGGMAIGGVSLVQADWGDPTVISPFVWRARKTEAGELVLIGHVPDQAVKDDLASAAEALSPGTVDDRTQLGAGAPEPALWGEVAKTGLAAVAALATGEAQLEDTTLTVRGIALDNATRTRVSAEVANVPAPFLGTPGIRGISLWRARHGPAGLVLSGRVASAAEQEEVIGIAETNYDGPVIDEMVITAEGPQDWMDGLRVGLPYFSRFQSGEMAFEPDGVGFRFEGEASGSTLVYLREDMSALEGGYGVGLEAEEVAVPVEEIAEIDFEADARGACEAAFAAVIANNELTFADGSAAITRESGVALDKIMAVAARCDEGLAFELAGHTDDRGERAVNLGISEGRARAVLDYMVDRGFDASRLSAVGYGPDRPVQSNATAAGRAANRRIEIRVLERSD